MNGNPNQWVANPNKDQIRALGQSPVFFVFFFFFFLFFMSNERTKPNRIGEAAAAATGKRTVQVGG